MKKNNIVLIGMPAAGKSTVGVVAAKRLGYQFIDTDLLIQQQEDRLLREIIEAEGNDGFLAIENQVNRDVTADRAVISPGGSIVYSREAMAHFQDIAVIIYLQVSYEELEKRLSNAAARGVVLKEGQTLRDLYNERKPLFEQYADVTVAQESGSIEETIEQVVAAFKYYGKVTDS